MPIPFKSYQEADAYVSDLGGVFVASSGTPKLGGYFERSRLPDGTHATISNGPWGARAPFTWTVTIVGLDET